MVSINTSSGGLSNLSSAQSATQKTLERISSGKQINSAADNSAGLAIINSLSTQSSGFSQAIANTSQGISLAQTASGTLSTVTTQLQRVRELAIQASNGTLDSASRQAIQNEANTIRTDISNSLDSANFNGTTLFNSATPISLQVGNNSDDTVSFSTIDLDATLEAAGISTFDFSTAAGASASLTSIDDGLSAISSQATQYGSLQNRLEASISNLETQKISSETARSRIEDADLAKETAELAKNQVQEQASIAILAQANADKGLISKLLS